MEVQTMTIDATAKALGISRSTCYVAIKKGDIPSLRICGRRLVPKVALEEMLKNAGKQTMAAGG